MSRDGFSKGKASFRKLSELQRKSFANEPLRTSTRTRGPGVPQWATTNSRSRKNKIRPQAKEISAMIRLEKTKEAGGWALKPKWQTPLPPRVSRKRSGHSICSEADGNSSRSPETLSIELPFQHSRNCHGFRRVTFRIASHDCTTEKSRDGFSELPPKEKRGLVDGATFQRKA